jgi:regulation of enolase protein 1 (concanavalin A-like superfamily)
MRAQGDSFGNDSVHVQFDDSVTAGGAPTMRIASGSSAEIVLQAGQNDTSVRGWGWADNGWGQLGPDIYFSRTGTHTLRVQQREDGVIIDQIVLSPNLYRTAAPGGRDQDSTILPATGGDVPASLPNGWQTANIGATSGGGAGERGGVFTVSGGGADIWGTADAFRFVYRSLAGDGTVVARVATVQNVDAWTKAGVMIRQSLDPASPHASMFVTAGKGLAFQSRSVAGGTSVSTAVAGTAPRWVRVVRAGQAVTASVSSDGTTWTDIGRRTISLSGAVYVGLAVTSHNTGQLAVATFEAVAATP